MHDYESLRKYFNDELIEIAEELDKEDIEKMRKFRDDFREKYSTNYDIEKKIK